MNTHACVLDCSNARVRRLRSRPSGKEMSSGAVEGEDEDEEESAEIATRERNIT